MKPWRIIAVLAMSFTLASRAYGDDAEEIAKLSACNVTLTEAGKRFNTILETWFGESPRLGLVANFRVVVKQHEEFFALVKENLDRFTPRATTVKELEEQLQELDRSHEKIVSAAGSLKNLDTLILESLPSIKAGLDEVQTELAEAESICPETNIDKAKKLSFAIDRLKRRLDEIAAYVAKSAIKRDVHFRAAASTKRLQLIRTLAEKTGQRLETVREQVGAILAADAVHRRLQEWWEEAAVTHGIARGLATRKLQYFAAVRQIQVDLARLDSFERQLRKLSDSTSVATDILDVLLDKRRILRDELTRLQSLGWKGIMERQRVLTDARSRRPATPACKSAIDLWRSMVNGTSEADAFRSVEHIYALQLEACKREEGGA